MLLKFKEHAPKVAPDAFVADTARVIGRATIGPGASIWFGAVIRADINTVSVGTHSNIQDNCVLHVGTNEPCVVKDNVLVGHQATVHGCTVEDGCLIGIRAVILNRAIVGEESIIGAGALIPEGVRIPPRSLVIGMPGRVVRKVTKEELEDVRYWVKRYYELGQAYRKQAASDQRPATSDKQMGSRNV